MKQDSGLWSLFKERLIDLSGEYISVHPDEEIEASVAKFCESAMFSSVVTAARLKPLVERLRPVVGTVTDISAAGLDQYHSIRVCAAADAGISKADAFLAESGTIVIASRFPGDRLVSTLPPVHLVIAGNAPIYKDFNEFMQTVSQDLTYTFISGPSRTADIEKVLVLGAHGPVRVVVWGRG